MSKCRLFKVGRQKIKELHPLRYLREVSVVIIGVATTFYLTDVLAESRERKEIKLHLNTIYSELEYNLEIVNDLYVYHANHLHLKELLANVVASPEEVNKDSLNHYLRVAFQTVSFTYKKGAYEMFINSGLMKVISDKQLLLDITDAYLSLEFLKEYNETYMFLKNLEYVKLYSITDFKSLNNEISITDPNLKSLLNFHTFNDGISSMVRGAKEVIETTLAKRDSIKQKE